MAGSGRNRILASSSGGDGPTTLQRHRLGVRRLGAWALGIRKADVKPAEANWMESKANVQGTGK